jgi:hypothetical protein
MTFERKVQLFCLVDWAGHWKGEPVVADREAIGSHPKGAGDVQLLA